ncbi:MAG TPA: TonB-dependent receptor, partial [Treponema sp.]|nr:TonB-dependent receptor [Treponema sp.]
KRFVTIMNVAELPSVFTLDGGLTLYPSKTVSVFFDGNNLFNEQWMSLDGYPMPSRSVTIGITITGG